MRTKNVRLDEQCELLEVLNWILNQKHLRENEEVMHVQAA